MKIRSATIQNWILPVAALAAWEILGRAGLLLMSEQMREGIEGDLAQPLALRDEPALEAALG